ncbi:MAG TPA: hypothetical protein VI699_05315 [Candidatus Acidoferrales bacterium]|nr:hypothetical protein [Candidatus Acidoferrales bacterium]
MSLIRFWVAVHDIGWYLSVADMRLLRLWAGGGDVYAGWVDKLILRAGSSLMGLGQRRAIAAAEKYDAVGKANA